MRHKSCEQFKMIFEDIYNKKSKQLLTHWYKKVVQIKKREIY